MFLLPSINIDIKYILSADVTDELYDGSRQYNRSKRDFTFGKRERLRPEAPYRDRKGREQ